MTNAQFRAIAKDVELVNGGAICADAPNVATASLTQQRVANAAALQFWRDLISDGSAVLCNTKLTQNAQV